MHGQGSPPGGGFGAPPPGGGFGAPPQGGGFGAPPQGGGFGAPPQGGGFGAPPQGGGFGAPPQGGGFGAPPQSPAAPPKKSKKGLIIGCCGGCALVLVALCGFGGYLGYLEEGVSYSDPGEEVTSIPVTPGVPFQLSYTFDGTGYATHRLYLEVTYQGELAIEGEAGCEQYGQMRMEPIGQYGYIDETRYQMNADGSQTKWMRLSDQYDSSSSMPVSCQGTIRPTGGQILSARAVITRRQRPSDWLNL